MTLKMHLYLAKLRAGPAALNDGRTIGALRRRGFIESCQVSYGAGWSIRGWKMTDAGRRALPRPR